jgi:hypothetical protein
MCSFFPGKTEKVKLVPRFQGKQTEIGETSFSRWRRNSRKLWYASPSMYVEKLVSWISSRKAVLTFHIYTDGSDIKTGNKRRRLSDLGSLEQKGKYHRDNASIVWPIWFFFLHCRRIEFSRRRWSRPTTWENGGEKFWILVSVWPRFNAAVVERVKYICEKAAQVPLAGMTRSDLLLLVPFCLESRAFVQNTWYSAVHGIRWMSPGKLQ